MSSGSPKQHNKDEDSKSNETKPEPIQPKSSNKLLERLSKGPIICAEGYCFEMERRGYLQIGAFVPIVVLEEPEALKQLHREFVRCGSDVIECFTYFAHKEKMAVIGKQDLVTKLNQKAIDIAFEVKKEFSETHKDLLIAGSIADSTIYQENNPDNDKIIKSQFREQVSLFAQNKVDYCIGETFDYVAEAILALEVILEFNLPAVITIAIHLDGKTRDGYTPEQACEMVYRAGATVVGLNCSRGPNTMLPLLKKIRARMDTIDKNIHIAGLPACYQTDEQHPTYNSFEDMKDHELKFQKLDCHQCTRFDLSDYAKECIDNGINYIGTCCGGAPHLVRAIAEAIGRNTIASKYSANMTVDHVFGDAKHAQNYNKKEADFR